MASAHIATAAIGPMWTIFGMTVLQPESLMMPNQSAASRILWWLRPPIVAVTIVVAFQLFSATDRKALESEKAQGPRLQAATSKQHQREYVLEVIGLGVTVDKYRQGKLWDALQKVGSQQSIREEDKEKYPWSDIEKAGLAGGRGGDSLENGAKWTPMYWAVPTFNAEPPILDPLMQDTPDYPTSGLVDGAVLSGLAWHLFVVGPRRFEERPDRILEEVFAFFDSNLDVPYVILNADDSMALRNDARPPGTPALLRKGRYITEMPDASTLFVLARRERVDVVRPFAFDDISPKASVDDLNRYGVARRLFLTYTQLMRSVPHPDRRTNPDALTERQPLISEWLPVAAQFAKRPELRSTSMLDALRPSRHHIPDNWKPTPWFPVPWNKDQLAEFDKLPTLGYIHRPTFIKFTGAEGKQIIGARARAKVLQAGFDDALLTLPAAQRTKSPSLIIAAIGGDAGQLVALHSVMRQRGREGAPEIDSKKTEQFIHTDKRLGNTGAATLFMQMAIGVMGSYRTGGISAAINLRDKDEATIVFISPPTDEQRAKQKHPTGTPDVFAHRDTPMIDPANYEQQP